MVQLVLLLVQIFAIQFLLKFSFVLPSVYLDVSAKKDIIVQPMANVFEIIIAVLIDTRNLPIVDRLVLKLVIISLQYVQNNVFLVVSVDPLVMFVETIQQTVLASDVQNVLNKDFSCCFFFHIRGEGNRINVINKRNIHLQLDNELFSC